MRYILEDTTLRFRFNTRQFTTGAPFTLAGTPSMSVYPEDSDTQITAGITLTVDNDSRTGFNNVVIDLSASASYTADRAYQVVIEAGTVDGVSVVNSIVYDFFIVAAGGMEDAITRTMLALPAAAAGAADGLWILGSNNTAAITIGALTTGAVAITTLSTSGAATFNSLVVTTTTTLTGNVSLGGTLGVAGTTTFAAVTTTGTVTLNALTVSNATTLTGAVSLGATLGVAGTTTLAAVTTTGTMTLNALTVSNATTLTGAVTATNASNDIRGVLLQKAISAAMDELTGDPGATPTGGQALMLSFMAIRNLRETTATTDEIHNNAGAVILTAALADDTVTFTKAKYA